MILQVNAEVGKFTWKSKSPPAFILYLFLYFSEMFVPFQLLRIHFLTFIYL